MTALTDIAIDVTTDAEVLARQAADWMAAALSRPAERLAVALSGGSTPRRLYQLLAEAPYREHIPWERVHWFWGDERFVPYDHPDSNFAMTRNALLAHVPVPDANIHAIPTGPGSPDECAAAYERELQAYYGGTTLRPERPLFDLTLLGLGPDGHTASLFPGTAVLAERTRWARAVVGAKPESRITLTYPALDDSAHVAFLVTGAEKRDALVRVLSGDMTLPASRIRPKGEVLFFVDSDAAA